jgi:hypothetical protein
VLTTDKSHRLQFSDPEMNRLQEHACALGTTYAELIRFLVLQGLDELDAIAREENGCWAPPLPRYRIGA